MKKVHPIILILLIFVLLNVIIVLLWPLRTSLKFSNYKAYSDEFIVSLNLDRKESVKLYLETWQRERLFEYDEFTGLRESVSIDGEYVNIDIENGRLISNNPKNCEKNIFFYGGENVFGYYVGDNQSTPYYFREILKKNDLNYCVFNFGRATYYSTQENILFQKHILKNKIKEKDWVIFLDGNNEIGNQKILNTDFIEKNYNALHQKNWLLYKAGIEYFITLLPATQLFEVLSKKISFNNKNKSSNHVVKNNLTEVVKVLEKNLKIRNAICVEYNFQCHNFLFFAKNEKKTKYDKLKNNENIEDLTNLHDKSLLINKHGSLSPESNKILANNIYEKIID